MNKFFIAAFILFLGTLAFTGCQEEFYARLDRVEPYLVVEGFISDQPGPHRVRLTMATPFQQPYVYHPVTGALLTITGNDGSLVTLEETLPGEYFTPESFQGQTGFSYILNIETEDGSYFRSEPQELLPPLQIDSIYGVLGEEIFYKPSGVSNTLFPFTVVGAHAFVTTSASGNSGNRFRFKSELYVQYTVPVSDVSFDACWIRQTLNPFLESDMGQFSNLDGMSQKMGFAPLYANGLSFFGFPDDLYYDQVRVLISKVYTLNQGSYDFHKARNEQLNTDGRIFDPINAQLPGNIHCISDPEKQALGFFEASALQTLTFRVVSRVNNGTVSIIPNPPLDQVPGQGCLRNQYPAFWVIND